MPGTVAICLGAPPVFSILALKDDMYHLRLSNEPIFGSLDLTDIADPSGFVGRAPMQVDQFIASVVSPIQANYNAKKPESVELRV